MSGSSAAVEWYIARDGQQFGPVSELEFGRLVESGHLKATDLVWREGFSEWRSASFLLSALAPTPPPAPPPPAYPAAGSAGTQAHQASERTSSASVQNDPLRRGVVSDARGSDRSGAASGGQSAPTYDAAAPYARSPAAGNPDPSIGSGPVGQNPSQNRGRGYAGDVPAGQTSDRGGRTSENATPVSAGGAGSRPAKARRPAAEPDFDDLDDDVEDGGARRWIKRVAIALVVFAMAGTAAWYAYPYREKFFSVATAVSSIGGGGSADSAALEISPFKGFQPSVEATDDALQKSLLWRTLKRDFPEWYANRLKDAALHTREKRSEIDVGRDMAQAVMQLRRQHSSDALSATMPRLRAVVVAFSENLQRLRKHSVDACYGYISAGEAHPVIVNLFQAPEHTSHLQKQITAVFEAIAEGRKTPRVYAAPKQADYNLLVVELESRGWTQADMQLFSDSKALAKAPPEKVCKLVQEWFEAQLAVKDQDAQLRLIVDALRPVVAG
jgi:hypothetical protein